MLHSNSFITKNFFVPMNRLQQFSLMATNQARKLSLAMLVLTCFLASYHLTTAQVTAASSCEYTLELTDTGGDGWDGAYIGVTVDQGTPVNYTVAGGSGNVITLPVNNGSTLDFHYYGAAFESQHSFAILDANGNTVYTDGPSPAEGAIETIKAECPQTCEGSEPYVLLLTMGSLPEEMSWELTNSAGARVAYANAGTYSTQVPGAQIPVAVSLNTCEGYSLTSFDGFNDGWNGGTWVLLSTNTNRGVASTDPALGTYQVVASGPGAFVDQTSYDFTLPCLECPSPITELSNTTDCSFDGFVYPAASLPTPVVCYPDVNGHGSPAPAVTISYPTASPAVTNQATSTAVDLPVGVNPVIFEMTYNDGQVIRCTSSVNIVSTLNPTLICNDNVILALNEPDNIDDDGSGSFSDDLGECVLEITPDMVLEMPGFCENEFTVTLLDNFGNELSNLVGPDMIGQTVEYRVNHISSNNICWGTITIEDKVAPVIQCRDYTIACNHPEALNQFYRYTPTFEVADGVLPANIAGGAIFPAPPSVTTLEFEVGCAPLGEYFWNVIVDLEINHTDLGDLEIVLVDPLGNTYILMNANNCLQGDAQDMNVTFDSYGDHPSITTACENGTINGTYAPVTDLSFDLPFAPFAGTWQVVITDSNNTTFPDDEVGLGEVVDATLSFTAGFRAPVRAYDCSEFNFQLLSEAVVETNCSEPQIGSQIQRVWRATDSSGNISTCLQTVKLQTPAFDDLTIPADLILECGSSTDIESTGVPTFDCFDINDDHTGLCDISYTFEDTEIPACGQGKKLIREWTIVNWCSSITREFAQVIQVEDRQGPVITANDINVSAATYSCDADILLTAFVEDACSGIGQVTASYVDGGGAYNTLSSGLIIVDITNTGMIEDLPEGNTEVLITAQDECGNSSIDTIQITVIDDVPPAAICDDDLHVTLNGAGSARIYAADIDEGSFDNCGIAALEVRRTDGCLGASSFDEYVDFDCCDIDAPVTVELRVTDFNGNSSLCWLPIQIEDKLPPIITCPTDKTINCDDNFGSLSQFGSANAIDNCEVDLTISESEDIDNCGAGIITRTWTATDPSGNVNMCTQEITVNHVSDFSVQFPADVTINSCTGELGFTGEPLINDDDCELIALSHDDKIFDVVPDACFKIIRTWTLINWCYYDLNAPKTSLGIPLSTPRTYQDDGDGYFEYTQEIKVVDTQAPVIDETSVSDVTVEIINECTETFLVPAATATDDCAGTFDVPGFPGSIVGTHGDQATVEYVAEDGCGNSDTYSVNVTFVDAKKPTPVCINGLSIEIMVTGQVVLWASDFESGSSYDNCSAYEDLEFSFSPNVADKNVVFTCDDLGTQIVELWATDEAGNQAFCSTYVIVQDNMGACDGSAVIPNVSVAGRMEDEQGNMVDDVTVELNGMNVPAFTTDDNGAFTFSAVPMYSNYDIVPEKNMDPLNGVSTFDLVLISQHVLGMNLLDSPYKMIAADINNDGNISTFDIVQLRQLILAIIQDFPTNTSWRFVDSDYIFPDSNNPFMEAFPEKVTLNNLLADEMDIDFMAIKVGDVDGSATPNTLAGTDNRNMTETLTFAIDNITTEKGDIHQVDFRARDFDDVLGYQFAVNFDMDALEFVGIEGQALEVTEQNFGLTLLDEGIITTSWNTNEAQTLADDEILFSLTFKTTVNAPISELIAVTSRFTPAEAYKATDNPVTLLDVALEFNGLTSTNIENGFELFQNRPNPFNGETVIAFNLPKASEASLKVYDVAGKLLYTTENEYAKGYNEVTIYQSDLGTTGILYYTLETPTATATKKMIILK